jgi:hypothetical protein
MLTPPDERFLRMRLQRNRDKTEVVIEMEEEGQWGSHSLPPARAANFSMTSGSSRERRTLSVSKDFVPQKGKAGEVRL